MLLIRRVKWIAVAGILLLCASHLSAEDWPAFRGPHGDGISAETHVPVRWSPQENIRWKVSLPARGNSSPIVSGGAVFLTLAEDEGRRRSLICYDRTNGQQRWKRTVAFDKVMPTHKTNDHCASTPAADGERVVAWYASAGLYCYDFSGTELWHRDLGEFRHMWGSGTSPVIHKGRVLLHSGPGEKVFVAALDAMTGDTLWETPEPVEGNERNLAGKYLGSWSTPIVVRSGDRELVVCSMPTRVNAYDFETGEIVLTCNGLRGQGGDLAYSSPLVVGDTCVAMGGFKGPAIGFRLSGRGDITAQHQLWTAEDNPQRIGTGIVAGDHIYMANAGVNTLQCIEPSTGKVAWEERNDGAAHWGSLVYAAGRIYGTDQDGTTHVFEADPTELKIVARNALGEPSNSTPAISDGQIFVRTFNHLYCIGE